MTNVLSYPLGNLGVTHRVHLWLDGKRIVDFLLAIIELFSIAVTAAALLSEICRNRRFSEGVDHWKMQEKKMRHKIAGVENAGKENAAQDLRGGKCGKSGVCW